MDKLGSGQMIEWEDLDKKRYYLIGPSLFLFVRGAVYPFTLIKTLLFMQKQNTIYTGTFDAFRKVLKHEGIRGLYKGYMVSTFGLVSGQLYITTYELIRSTLRGYSTEVKGFLAGGGATLVAQTVTVPIDIISQHMMMQGHAVTKKAGNYIVVKNVDYVLPREPRPLRGALTIVKRIARTEGFRGFYRGYQVSLMTYMPSSALWWMFYGGLFQRSINYGAADVMPIPLVQVFCAVTGSVMASILTNPLDVIRTRYQLEDTHSLRATLRRFWHEEGLGGLKKGLSARILSSAPTSAILVTSYEWVKRMSLRVDRTPTLMTSS